MTKSKISDIIYSESERRTQSPQYGREGVGSQTRLITSFTLIRFQPLQPWSVLGDPKPQSCTLESCVLRSWLNANLSSILRCSFSYYFLSQERVAVIP
nr:MAG TPA: hypothetical protein [Caudoviricetes sp.]